MSFTLTYVAERERLRAFSQDGHLATRKFVRSALLQLGVSIYDYGGCLHYPDVDKGKTSNEAIPQKFREPHNSLLSFKGVSDLGNDFCYAFRDLLKDVDLFVCGVNCHLQFYLPLERPIIYYLCGPIENYGSFNPRDVSEWAQYVNLLRQQGQDGSAIKFIACNTYHQHYIKYLTGFDVPIARPDVGHVPLYTGSGGHLLIGPGRRKFSHRTPIVNDCRQHISSHSRFTAVDLAELFPFRAYRKSTPYTFEQVGEAAAMIVIPYAPYTGTLSESLGMGLPMFFPSPALLTKWHVERGVMQEKDGSTTLFSANASFLSLLNRKLNLPNDIPSPFENRSYDAMLYWFRQCDWYDWPIETFDSFDELTEKLEACDLSEYSRRLRKYYLDTVAESTACWSRVLLDVERFVASS